MIITEVDIFIVSIFTDRLKNICKKQRYFLFIYL